MKIAMTITIDLTPQQARDWAEEYSLDGPDAVLAEIAEEKSR